MSNFPWGELTPFLLAVALFCLVWVGVHSLLQRQRKQTARALAKWARSKHAQLEHPLWAVGMAGSREFRAGLVSQYAFGKKELQARMEFQIPPHLPASEFVAMDSLGMTQVVHHLSGLHKLPLNPHLPYRLRSEAPQFVEYLLSLGLARKLAAYPDFGLRILPEGWLYVEPVNTPKAAVWTEAQLEQAYQVGTGVADLLSQVR